MHRVVRHDAITLQRGVKEEDFERFVRDELIPYFSERYRGPTRSSVADLKSQMFLKNAHDQQQWLWVTVWDGSPDAVAGSSFEHVRMSRIEETDAMLKKLEFFGKRTSEEVFSELDRIEVPTNT